MAHICRLVAGLPLAIELAAVLLRDTEPQQLSQEIDASLDVLATTMRDVPARHRSLRAVFAHSWDLLSEPEQTVFARLSVSRGGFTHDAAVEIADTSPEILTGITQKSLLRHVDDDRYEMHEVLRQYAAEQLAPEDDAAHGRHCHYYTTFVRQYAKTSAATCLLDGLNAIRNEIDNVRAAWRWAIAQPAIEALERSHAALASYYDHRYLFDEGETAFRRAVTAVRSHAATEYGNARSRRTLAALLAEQARFLARQARYEPAIRTAQEAIAIAVDVNDLRTEAAGHLQWGRALENQGLYEEAQTHYEQVLSLASSVAIPLLEAESLLGLGGVSQKQTDYVGSEPYYERALVLFQDIGDRQWEAFALHNLGHIYRVPGDYDTARRYYEEAMELYRTIDDRAGKGMVLSSLGAMLSEQGRFAEARTYTEQYLVRMREVGDRREEGVALVNLGLDSLCLGNFEMAGAYLRRSLELRRHIGDRQGEGWSLMALGFLANQAGAHDDAVDYCRQALDYAEALGDLQVEAHALTHLGHALTALGQLEDAGEAYSHARRLYRELGWTNSAMEPQAGLAHVALLQDDVNGAETYIEDVVSHMEIDFLDGTFDPVRICLTCYRVLDAGGDVRARVVLDAAYEYLQEQAKKISDNALQRSFLENVPAHRELTGIYRRAEAGG